MRRVLCVLLLIVLLTGCGASRKEMKTPVNFYYDYADAHIGPYGEETGALAVEVHDLGEEMLNAAEILQRYMAGPAEGTHVLPFPEGTSVQESFLREGILTVVLSEEAAELTGIDRTMAAACLTKTMTQFADINGVLLECNGQLFWDDILRESDILLLDDTATSNAVMLKLYYGSPDGRYLTEEVRSVTFQSDEEIPMYIIQQLVNGSQSGSGKSLLPDGTRVLSVQNMDGVCTVDLSESFLWYQPSTHLDARRSVLSMVNALTELPEVACVRFLCGGSPLSYYMGLDLSETFYRDETAFGAGLGQEGAVDVTLYLPCGRQERLATVPLVLSMTSGQSLVNDTLAALLSVETLNGYVNPFPEGTEVLSADTAGDLCTVTFNSAFALCDSSEAQAKRAVRSVVATLCGLPGIDRVKIEIQNDELSHMDLSEPMTVEQAWLLP